MNYWVREVPAGAGVGSSIVKPDHWIVHSGEKACNQGSMPIKFPSFEMAQAMANALAANPPTEDQEKLHEGEEVWHLKRFATAESQLRAAWKELYKQADTAHQLKMLAIGEKVGIE